MDDIDQCSVGNRLPKPLAIVSVWQAANATAHHAAAKDPLRERPPCIMREAL